MLLFIWAPAWPQSAPAADSGVGIAPDSGSFVFMDEKGDPSKQIIVYTFLQKRRSMSPACELLEVFGIHGQKNICGSEHPRTLTHRAS